MYIDSKEFKILQYADDTALFLDGSVDSFRNALHILNSFGRCTGLKINMQKTQAVWIGASKSNPDINIDSFQVDFVHDQYFRYLGTDFHVNIDKIPDYNYDRIFDRIKRQMISWSKRNITVLGRVVVVKSLLLPQFNHLFISTPNPSSKLMKTIKVRFLNFIWNNKPDKINRKQIVSSYQDGGLKMVDVELFCNALKMTWIRRVILNKCIDVKHLMQSFLKKSLLLDFGDKYYLSLAQSVENPFWKDVFYAVHLLIRADATNWLSKPLWKNSSIQIGRDSLV